MNQERTGSQPELGCNRTVLSLNEESGCYGYDSTPMATYRGQKIAHSSIN